jgi:hypothetical protein
MGQIVLPTTFSVVHSFYSQLRQLKPVDTLLEADRGPGAISRHFSPAGSEYIPGIEQLGQHPAEMSKAPGSLLRSGDVQAGGLRGIPCIERILLQLFPLLFPGHALLNGFAHEPGGRTPARFGVVLDSEFKCSVEF